MRLRTHFTALVAVTLLPLLALAAAVVLLALRDRHASLERSLQESALALAVAVDRELDSSVTALRTLAASPALDEGNYRVFYEQARRARDVNPPWLTVYLIEASGHQILTLLRPLGTTLPNVADFEFMRAVRETGRPYVSDLTFGPVSQRHIITVDVPVVRSGQLRYVLGASMVTDALADLLRTHIPADAVAVLRDRKNVLVARSRDHARHVGSPPRPEIAAAVQRAREGGRAVFEVDSLEGVRVYTATSRVARSDFVVAVAVPVASVMRGPQKLWWALAIGGAIILAGALTASALLARRIARPIQGLSRTAAELARGEPLSPGPPTSVEEVAAVRKALVRAAHEVRERTAERERRIAAEAAHDEAEQRTATLERTAREKDEFLAMLAHELRNPLGAIANANAILSRLVGEDGTAARARAIIGRQVQQLGGIVDDLLDVSRVTIGKIVLMRRPVDFAAIVHRAVEMLEAEAKASHLGVTCVAEPVWVDGDETRLEQVVSNLLANAVKFTPAGGRIDVSVVQDNDTAILRVADTGIGISNERLPLVFDLFFQGERTLDRAQGGLGIGLTLVKRLVELHGGSVVAISDGADRGSTFVVRLPAIPPVPPAPADAPPRRRQRRRRVLLVEDHGDAREMLRVALEMNGHTVYEAVDGKEGIDLACAHHPDVAVVDIGLPGTDGYEVGRRLRQGPAGAAMLLIALTGYGQPEDLRRSQEAGFDAHLVKPVDPERLEQLMMRDEHSDVVRSPTRRLG